MHSNDAKTIYLNHAGTSWPKPPAVVEATTNFQSADPSEWPELFKVAFRTVADFFHVERSRLLLTPSCTAALNLAVFDHDWQAGDRILTSSFEHHALSRNFLKLEGQGVATTRIPRDTNELLCLEILEKELNKGQVKLVAVTAACNVTGQLLPIRDIIELVHQFDSLVLIDGAQIAGWFDLDLSNLGADLFTFAGHKGTLAPWGIGGLYVKPETPMQCASATCELSDPTNTIVMPGYCDAGSVNLSSLLGLAAGCQWLSDPRNSKRLTIARELASQFCDTIRDMPGTRIYHDVSMNRKMPSVAVAIENMSSTQIVQLLRAENIIASGGFQCSPDSHQSLNTQQDGLTRFSFAPRNTSNELVLVAKHLRDLLKKC